MTIIQYTIIKQLRLRNYQISSLLSICEVFLEMPIRKRSRKFKNRSSIKMEFHFTNHKSSAQESIPKTTGYD